MSKKILTGITPSGKPHLGNILGAILPAIELSKNKDNACYYFISDYHSLTSNKDPLLVHDYTFHIAATWLAFNYQLDNNYLYRQSKLKSVCELAWILGTITPYAKLLKSHAFKDKSDNLSDVNVGLFYYPILMTADILLFNADVIPVGSDQKQHIEIARDIAIKFNNTYGETFTVPEAMIREDTALVVGVDGRKMSKSYNNYIDIFAPKNQLKKTINSIVTDSKGVAESKDYETCNVYKIYSALADQDDILQMQHKYTAGNYGYGQAKAELLELILTKFGEQIERRQYYIDHPDMVYDLLTTSENKLLASSEAFVDTVKAKVGLY